MQSALNLRVLLATTEHRERQLRRTRLQVRSTRSSRTLRRDVARQLIRAGERLASDTTLRPVGSR